MSKPSIDQWVEGAPAPSDLKSQIAKANFDVLSPHLLPEGRDHFWADVDNAANVHEVLAVVDAWMMTLQFLQSPGSVERLSRAHKARRAGARGESTKDLFTRLGI